MQHQVVYQQQQPKPNKPAPFQGNMAEREHVLAWFATVETFFLSYPASTDNSKISFVATLLQGSASTWWLSAQTTHTAAGATFAAFKQDFLNFFSLPNADTRARTKLTHLHQTNSVAEYISEFRRISMAIHPSLDEDSARHQFLSGLKPRVREMVVLRDHTSLDSLMAAADRIDQSITLIDESTTTDARHSTPVDPSTTYSASAPLTLTPHPPRKRLTAEEREHLRTNNGCFYCRQIGHRVSECPNLANNK
jgi:hypothetical protein